MEVRQPAPPVVTAPPPPAAAEDEQEGIALEGTGRFIHKCMLYVCMYI